MAKQVRASIEIQWTNQPCYFCQYFSKSRRLWEQLN